MEVAFGPRLANWRNQAITATVPVNEFNCDLSPTIPVFDSAPIRVAPISQLHSLITVEIHTEPSTIVLGEFEPEGLDSLAI